MISISIVEPKEEARFVDLLRCTIAQRKDLRKLLSCYNPVIHSCVIGECFICKYAKRLASVERS